MIGRRSIALDVQCLCIERSACSAFVLIKSRRKKGPPLGDPVGSVIDRHVTCAC